MGGFGAVPAPAALRGRWFRAGERGVRGGYMRADGWWGLERSSGRSLKTELLRVHQPQASVFYRECDRREDFGRTGRGGFLACRRARAPARTRHSHRDGDGGGEAGGEHLARERSVFARRCGVVWWGKGLELEGRLREGLRIEGRSDGGSSQSFQQCVHTGTHWGMVFLQHWRVAIE